MQINNSLALTWDLPLIPHEIIATPPAISIPFWQMSDDANCKRDMITLFFS